MQIEMKRVYSIFCLLSYGVTLALGIGYLYSGDIGILLVTVLALLVSNCLMACLHLKYWMIHLLFYITIFVFLVSRPTIEYIKQGYLDSYQTEVYRFTFILVAVSLLGLLIGGVIAEGLIRLKPSLQRQSQPISLYADRLRLQIRQIALIGFAVTYPFYVLRLLERLRFRLNTSYYTYYASFQSKLPYFTYILSAFMFYLLCLYLATKPKKLPATIVLGCYVMANAIHLFIGTRNPVILSIIFAFVYYFMRNQEERGRWIGFKEKTAIWVLTPLLALFMGAMNYLRDNVAIKQMNIGELLLDFLYKQGTSFGVLANGYLYQTTLPIREFRNYTFGPIIEYLTRGNLGNLLFDTEPFRNTVNSLELALESNSFAHNLSYLVKKQEYLAGHGVGSSYMMEIFIDYGMWGVLILSIVLGIIFVYMLKIAYSRYVLAFAIQLVILSNLFFMPRSSFSESFFNLFTVQFWFLVVVVYLVSWLLAKPMAHWQGINNTKQTKGRI